MSNYKSMAHSIREILEGKQVDPNQKDLDKLKKVAKVDETEAEEKLDENQLEFGTDAARDKYSNDTPGQTPGVEHNAFQQGPNVALAVDGVPKPGGLIDKPKLGLKEAIRQVTSEKKDDVCSCGCDCGKEVCESCGKRHEAKDVEEGLGDMVKKGVDKVKKVRDDIKNFHKTDAAAAIRKDGAFIKKKAPIVGTNEEVINERNTNVKDAGKTKAVWKIGKAKPIPGHPDYKGPQNPQGVKEEGRWDETDDGKAYRAMSPEEKHQHKLKKQVMKKSKELKGDKKAYAKEEALVSMLNDMIDRYQLDEAAVISKSSSSAEKKMAANKIFRMHQAKQAAKATPKNDAGARAAKRDSAGYKTSDDSHLYQKPSKPEPKRGRGERDLPHIATQLRGVVDMGDKHSGVKFKDGTTKKVSPDHAKSWLKKHDSSKPQQRLAMYKSHDSHSEFQKHK